MVDHNLPVKVGQVAESRSLIPGFRGAWFRCKIKKITRRDGDHYVSLEYVDFPDEKILSTKLYQRIPSVGRSKAKKPKQLMVRPCFPPVYRKSEKPDINNISEVTVIAEDEWKVGDFVDWWTDGCYWSGRVTKILNNENLQIELHRPPEGEGMTYDVSSKDLRPSLDWFPESGWTLPARAVSGHIRPCAQVIKPVNEGKPVGSSVAGEAQKKTITAGGSSNTSFSSQTQSRNSSAPLDIIPVQAAGPLSTDISKGTLDVCGSGVQKAGSSDSICCLDIQVDEKKDVGQSVKKLKSESTIRLNSVHSDTLEAAVLDLETLAFNVRMFQNILKSGVASKISQSPLESRKM